MMDYDGPTTVTVYCNGCGAAFIYEVSSFGIYARADFFCSPECEKGSIEWRD